MVGVESFQVLWFAAGAATFSQRFEERQIFGCLESSGNMLQMPARRSSARGMSTNPSCGSLSLLVQEVDPEIARLIFIPQSSLGTSCRSWTNHATRYASIRGLSKPEEHGAKYFFLKPIKTNIEAYGHCDQPDRAPSQCFWLMVVADNLWTLSGSGKFSTWFTSLWNS